MLDSVAGRLRQLSHNPLNFTGLEALAVYLDAAALSELPWANIIHGKGTGRLREAVRRELNVHYAVAFASWEGGKQGEGRVGVTVIKFKR